MIPDRPTGNTRFRVQGWTHLLVLQVQVEFDDGPPDSNGMAMWLAGKMWRDARTEDLAALPQMGVHYGATEARR